VVRARLVMKVVTIYELEVKSFGSLGLTMSQLQIVVWDVRVRVLGGFPSPNRTCYILLKS